MRCNAIGRPPGSQIAALILMFSSCAFARMAPQDAIGFFQGETHRLFPPPGTLMFPRRRDYSAARHRAPLPVRLNLGVFYRDTGRLADADKAFCEALTIYRETSPPRSAASVPRIPCHP